MVLGFMIFTRTNESFQFSGGKRATYPSLLGRKASEWSLRVHGSNDWSQYLLSVVITTTGHAC